MAALSIVGAVSNEGGHTSTSTTCTIPSDTATNDVLIVSIFYRNSGGSLSVTDDDAGGNSWAAVSSETSPNLAVYWKRATSGTASKTITVAHSGGTCLTACLAVFRGVALDSTPYNTPVSEANTSTNVAHAAYTTARSGSWLVMCAGSQNTALLDDVTATDPATVTVRCSDLSAAGNDGSSTISAAAQTAAGSTGAFAWTGTGADTRTTAFELYSERDANATVILDGIGISATGTAIGDGALITLGTLTSSATGTVAIVGTGAISLDAATLSGAGLWQIYGPPSYNALRPSVRSLVTRFGPFRPGRRRLRNR